MRTYIADSYAWIDYFDNKLAFKQLIEENMLKTPSLAVAEISRILQKRKVSPDFREKALAFIFKHSVILDLDFGQAVKGGKLSEDEKLHLSDAIIYSYASEEEPVLTGDPHFKEKEFVEFVE
ncbi:PIN domain-containing protein [Candidatus Micrarchaeota archaeon]|nr:PIN domain-containing protein [Candidatus Micrarchaeota archaeon]